MGAISSTTGAVLTTGAYIWYAVGEKKSAAGYRQFQGSKGLASKYGQTEFTGIMCQSTAKQEISIDFSGC
jgi:hypothetical protein